MRFTDEMSDDDGVAVIHEAYRRGVTYFDTAPGYCGDRSETIYGKALRTMPGENWTIATKGMNTLFQGTKYCARSAAHGNGWESRPSTSTFSGASSPWSSTRRPSDPEQPSTR